MYIQSKISCPNICFAVLQSHISARCIEEVISNLCMCWGQKQENNNNVLNYISSCHFIAIFFSNWTHKCARPLKVKISLCTCVIEHACDTLDACWILSGVQSYQTNKRCCFCAAAGGACLLSLVYF